MALRQIRYLGDDILRKKARPVTNFDARLHQLLDDMWETLRDSDGLGLAAPQVGMLRRVVIIDMSDDEAEYTYELINPIILESSGAEVKLEACLSIKDKQGDVERPTYVKVEACDRHGSPFELEAEDMLAVALCHELDHLDGVLFIDKALNISDREEDD